MSATSTALIVIGVILVVVGAASMALDLSGRGDFGGLDPKDLGTLVVGILLLVVGGWLRGRTPTPGTAS